MHASIKSGRSFRGLKSEANMEAQLVPKEVWLYVSLQENDPTSHLICYVSKHFPNGFMVSVTSFMSPSIQHNVHFVIYGPI